MELGYISAEPTYKRLPLDRDTVLKVTAYGLDNLYPMRMAEALALSPIGKSAVNLMAQFIRGDGFEKGDEVLNEAGQTANDILYLVSQDKATFDGYGLHINSNLLGIAKEVRHVNFDFIRLGLANQKGLINDVRVSNNWDQDSQELPDPATINEVRYLIYDPEKSANEVLTTGKGMIVYNTPQKNTYPLATFDACIESIQSDAELQTFELSNIVNGFLSMSIFKLPSGGNSVDEKEALQKKLNTLKGAKNANSIIVASIDEEFAGGDLIEQIPALNNDSLFSQTTENVLRRIQGNYSLPSSLLGFLPTGSFITSQQIQDDFNYMNARTRDVRLQIERQFEALGLKVGKIIPRNFNVENEEAPIL